MHFWNAGPGPGWNWAPNLGENRSALGGRKKSCSLAGVLAESQSRGVGAVSESSVNLRFLGAYRRATRCSSLRVRSPVPPAVWQEGAAL